LIDTGNYAAGDDDDEKERPLRSLEIRYAKSPAAGRERRPRLRATLQPVTMAQMSSIPKLLSNMYWQKNDQFAVWELPLFCMSETTSIA
jgi:hypothetical protein